MSKQSLEQIEIHENFLSDKTFDELIKNITKIQDKFNKRLGIIPRAIRKPILEDKIGSPSSKA